VFTKKIGDTVQRGERVGLIKFGSRTDVLLDPSAQIQVEVGDRVKGGSSVLGFLIAKPAELAGAAAGRAQKGSR
jgi:phosphatidylserine decarboxylase